jgi:acyl-CoA reductase-like NAD-dependent aldehyde dehydrogenase
MAHLAEPNLIAGEWVISNGPAAEIRSPYDQTVAGCVRAGSREDLECAIFGAEVARPVLRDLSGTQRADILRTVSERIASQRKSFAELIAREAGKPLKAAAPEVDRAVFTFALAAKAATSMTDEQIEVPLPGGSPARKGTLRRVPAGTVAAITPFNFPLNLVAHKLAPAIAAGCPVLLKPAPQTPLTALKLARLIVDAGLPQGALSVLPLSNDDAAALVANDRVKVLSFTGSAKVGWELKVRAGKKRVLLELGGNAAVIVAPDADLSAAAERCAFGGFTYSGQSCISVQRIYVQRSRYKDFLDLLVPRVRALKSGDPLDPEVDCGPLIRESDAARVESWIQEAVSGGARLLCGGKRKGSFVEPAVLTNTRPEQKVNAEEVFGPVVTVEPYDDPDDAIRLTNHSRYGLQAGIFTKDNLFVKQAFRQLEVGGLIVNDVPTFRSDAMPYGGVKDSGLGREGVRYAIEEMTELRILVE